MEDASDDEVNRNKNKCFCCGAIFGAKNHEYTAEHRFNFMLWTFERYRKPLGKDKHNVSIEVETKNIINKELLHVETTINRARYSSVLKEQDAIKEINGISYTFKVNTEQPVILMKIDMLKSHSKYVLNDRTGLIKQGKMCKLVKNEPYIFGVTLHAKEVGEYVTLIGLQFKNAKKTEMEFYIVKEMEIKIVNEYAANEVADKLKSKFTGKEWEGVRFIDPGKCNLPNYKYEIPGKARNALRAALHKWHNISLQDETAIVSINQCISKLTRENYKDFFHYLLWLDESGAQIKILKYNMENVTVKLKEGNKYIELEVKNLGEKRPSILRGDTVNLRIHNNCIVFVGRVKEVHENDIWIEHIAKNLIDTIIANPLVELDVQFDISRSGYEWMHRAVNLCTSNMLDILFPNDNTNVNKNRRFELKDSEFINKDILHNAEQKAAVDNILNGTSGNVPYVVFGPPGTGKTVTIVEAICQIVKNIPNSRILVTAPANAACDMIVTKLYKYFNENKMIRIHSETADWRVVPMEARKCSNRTETSYEKISAKKLLNFRIVVTTLVSAGRYSKSEYKASHVFIDEAAQALEPESVICFGGILQENGQLILAGDPKQLGPICNSLEAEKRGLGKSLLTRLMELPLYNKIEKENPNSGYFITKLLLNYRNNPKILKLPNEFFYDFELKPTVSETDDPISSAVLPVTDKAICGQPVEFYAVYTKENRQGSSPSYFNELEVQIVLKYVDTILQSDVKVRPDEIGIITPYMRQVHRIRNRLADRNIEVGTTETFQGREKRIIILSTVRAQKSLFLYDQKYNIGFLKNPQRFNVAITRAKSKLIVIGNPFCLCTDIHWRRLMEYCRLLNSYRGEYFTGRNEKFKKEITESVSKFIKQKNQCN